MINSKNKLIVALDVETFDQARKLIDELESTVDIFKVGLQQFTAYGPFVCRYLQAKGKKVFLDLKFHDIPNTVASAVKSAVNLSVPPEAMTGFEPLFMLTVHTVGGGEMLQAAVKAAHEQAAKLGTKPPLIVGVTVLTSQAKADNMEELVLERAQLAKDSGLDGVVASVEEAAAIRKQFGKDFIIVTPGIRPADASVNDQKRVATPKVAIQSGSSFLVVGRPIVQDQNPHLAATRILEEINSVS